MNKRQRRKVEKNRVSTFPRLKMVQMIEKELTEQEKSTRYFNQQIDEIQACSKAMVM